MLCQSHEIMAQQLAAPRWKEWIPLVTQQLRLRNLVQIIAFNVSPDSNTSARGSSTQDSERDSRIVKSKSGAEKIAFYYSLHLTTMSAPFYTSEKLENDNPKWSEIELANIFTQVNAAVNGIVVRLWRHQEKEPDRVITVWGVYFSGLVYLGPKLISDPSKLRMNSIVFHMHGGYFTAVESLKEQPSKCRNTNILIDKFDVKAGYPVNSLLRLQTIQHTMRKNISAAQDLREKITVGGFTPESYESSVLRRLLNESRPKAPKRQELMKAREGVEMAKFRVDLLLKEKARKLDALHKREKFSASLREENEDRGGVELFGKYQNLHKDMERLKERKKNYVETREEFLHTSAQLTYRRKQLTSELNQIYPIIQTSESKFSICGVYLPNSDTFSVSGSDEVMMSVALGLVAHLVQMVSVFLQVPLRYPIVHFSSRSRIVDHVAKIPDKDREFPLYTRGADRLKFNYGVYLLNKNIAQLRWYCGIATPNLPATLPNILALLVQRTGANGLELPLRSTSGSSLDLRSSSQTVSPVGSFQPGVIRRHHPAGFNRHFEKGHRMSKSMGSSELKFPLKQSNVETRSTHSLTVMDTTDTGNTISTANNLSYSLDKGLDEYEGMAKPMEVEPSLGLKGSVPILSAEARDKLGPLDVRERPVDGAQTTFLQSWQAGGGLGQVYSDDDTEITHRRARNVLKSVDQEIVVTCSDSCVEGSIPNEKDSIPVESLHEDSEAVFDTAESIDDNAICDIAIETPLPQEIVDGSSQCELTPNVEECIVAEESNNQSLATCFSERMEDIITEVFHPTEQESEVTNKDNLGKNGQDANESIANSELRISSQAVVLISEVKGVSSENQSILEGVSEMLVEDNLFASVASRTEALANRKTSFNRVRSRHSASSLEDGHS